MKEKEAKEKLEAAKPHDQYMTTDARALSRQGFELAVPDLVSIAKGEDPTANANARMRAVDMLGKYGLGKASILVEKSDLMRIVFQVTARHLAGKEEFDKWSVDLFATLEFQL
jgi:hypothetical protein